MLESNSFETVFNDWYKKFLKEESEMNAEIKNAKKYRDAGAYGVGMSSFGPTVYTVVDNRNKEKVLKATKDLLGEDVPIFVTKGQNSGYVIEK